MSLRDKLRKAFLRTIEKAAIKEMKRRISLGVFDPENLVDVRKELADAKKSIGSKADVLGVTDEDLQGVILRVCSKLKLEVKE